MVAARYIRRRRQIVGTFAKHGLDYFIHRFGLDNLAPVSWRTNPGIKQPADQLLARNLREALVELGPTFVKLGQVLSTRPDILPPVYIEELEKLQDKVDPVSYEEIVRVLSQEIGKPEEVFAEFNPEPLAAASIGQVHQARLKGGEKVIVKIQRPGIVENVKSDLEIIKGLAHVSETRSPEARRLGLLGMVEDYAKTCCGNWTMNVRPEILKGFIITLPKTSGLSFPGYTGR